MVSLDELEGNDTSQLASPHVGLYRLAIQYMAFNIEKNSQWPRVSREHFPVNERWYMLTTENA